MCMTNVGYVSCKVAYVFGVHYLLAFLCIQSLNPWALAKEPEKMN